MTQMKSIVAAISLAHQENGGYTEATNTLLNMAPVLARKLNADLTFVNVFEPTQAPPWGEIPMPDKIKISRSNLDKALRIGKEYALEKYRQEIAGLVKQHSTQNITGVVLEAKDAAEGIISEAIVLKSDLVVTGTSRTSYKYIYSGFSTSLSLMSSSPAPVLVMPEEASIDWNQDGLKILVADDLRSDSIGVMGFAANLAMHFNRSVVQHIHVIENSPQALGLDLADDEVRNLCEQELHRRSQEFISLSHNRVEYKAQAIFGQVDAGIERIIEDQRPDLIVFGRHRMIKVRPLMIGRMTSRALLDLKRPVIVVPR
ncbi:MAG: universal stress protein [Pseudobdellovibrionaceae bacterium]|nr:universal stress protein [Pseudobdellovibrionaceae bacterium]